MNNFGSNFSSKSRFYPIDEFGKINEDFTDYECNITLANHTSSNDYFHISYLAKNLYPPYIQKNVLDAFNIKVDFPVIYFTRQYPYVIILRSVLIIIHIKNLILNFISR